MQLTEDERAALERWRLGTGTLSSITRDAYALSRAMNRLFPVRTYGDLVIRWDDPITPERLVACGFKPETRRYGDVLVIGVLDEPMYTEIAYRPADARLFVEAVKMGCEDVPWFCRIRNMGEVWQLMERCGIEEGGK